MRTKTGKMAKALGVRLGIARKVSGMDQPTVAEKVKVTQATVSNWERGRSEPSVSQLAVLAKLYGVALPWFLSSEAIIPGEVKA